MNPWMSEMLGAAHREDLRRMASRVDRQLSPARPSAAGRTVGWRMITVARQHAGRALIRAGSRVGGLDPVAPVALVGPGHSAAC